VVRAGASLYAIPILLTRKILRNVKVNNVPGSERALLGLAQTGGEPLPVLDAAALAGDDTVAGRGPYLTVVLELGSEAVGLAVDDACDVIALAPEQVAATGPGVVLGEAMVGERLLRVLDPTRLGEQE
jgi:chemotaxis signal transduction protein